MAEPLEIRIAHEVSKCNQGDSSLEEFRQWFVQISVDIESSGDRIATALALQIDGILAEASSAGWSDADIVEELAQAVSPFVSGIAEKSQR